MQIVPLGTQVSLSLAPLTTRRESNPPGIAVGSSMLRPALLPTISLFHTPQVTSGHPVTCSHNATLWHMLFLQPAVPLSLHPGRKLWSQTGFEPELCQLEAYNLEKAYSLSEPLLPQP